MASDRVRRVVWRRRDTEAIEWCELSIATTTANIRGIVVMSVDGAPWRISYSIDVDAEGRTRSVTVDVDGPQQVSIALSRDSAGRWFREGRVVIDEPEALDVDLGFSPSTNTLPIRRLGLKVGESREIGVAWVLFPSFEVQHGRQTYTRLAERRWRYQSTGFDAELTVDEDGLVESYAVWESVARS